MQINFFGNDSLYLKWIAIKGDYKLSFGFSKTDIRINDIIFDFMPLQTDIFKIEFQKYVKVLKTI